MDILICKGRVFDGEGLVEADVLVQNGRVEKIGRNIGAVDCEVFHAEGCIISPGFTDLHVHLREPGFGEKETIATGTAAAAAGGFTTVCAMPNLNPVPDDLQHLEPQLEAIAKEARVCVLPYAAATVGQKGACPADIDVLAPVVAGFTDDGRGVQSDEMMRRVMQRVSDADSFVAAHCEVDALLPEDCTTVQEGCAFAAEHGYAGVSNESEYAEVERDIRVAADTGCRLHICHTSAAQSFGLVGRAQDAGLPVTCEVTPHNLLLSCDNITEDDGRFKMNPPLRTPEDREAAVEALRNGVATAIATDHAPHTEGEKAGGFAKALNGVVGLETAFASVYTGIVATARVPLTTVLKALTSGPRAVLGAEQNPLREGEIADLVVLDLHTERAVEPDEFLSKGRSTPFKGQVFKGWPVLTVAVGKEVYRRGRL